LSKTSAGNKALRKKAQMKKFYKRQLNQGKRKEEILGDDDKR
jgi:hypothetical protein